MSDAAFWAKVDTAGDCWTYGGYRDARGYGRLSRRRVSTSPILAHRYSWLLTHGPIPDGLFVCHRCDNPSCVRVDHLFLGTHDDNMADMRSKERGTNPPTHSGWSHHNASATDDQVREARQSYALGLERQRDIADRLGVSQTDVSSWTRGDTRLDAGGPLVPRRARATKAEMARRRAA